MKFKYLSLVIFLIAWVGVSCVALYNLSLRPALPSEIQETPYGVFLATPDSGLQQIEYAAEKPVTYRYEINDIVDLMDIGNTLSLRISNGTVIQFTLEKRYELWALLLKGLVGLIFFAVATIVWINAEDEGEQYFAISGYLFGFTIIAWWSGMKLPLMFSVPFIVIYFLAYPQAVFTFFYFSYSFPDSILLPDMLRKRKTALQFMGVTLSVILMVLYFAKVYDPTPETMRAYHNAYRYFRMLVIFTMAFAVINMFKNEARKSNPVNQRKLQWVIGGVLWGIFPFMFFWNLPHMLGLDPVLPEWVFDLFFVIAPICIAIAILKYRLFDIEIVLSRSLAYGAVISILIGVYVLIVGGMSALIYQQFSLESPYFSILSVVIIALLFNPLKRAVQSFIDKKFFRIRYHQFRSMQKFLTDLESCSDQEQILNTLQTNFDGSIPLKQQLFMAREVEQWTGISDGAFDLTGTREFLTEQEDKIEELAITISGRQTKKIERRLELHKADLPENWVVMLPIRNDVVWLLGEKQSRRRFYQEDLELAKQMARAANLQWEKLSYVQLAVRETLEKEQAQKLSLWKSMLVAEVAHDLRAPLNTMMWKLKNLQTELVENPTPNTESLDELQQQILRLQAFVQNMLRLSKKEHGELKINTVPCMVSETVDNVLSDLQKLVASKKLEVLQECDPDTRILADPVMLQEVLLNLVDNAAKFSRKKGKIHICTKPGDNNSVTISIEDEGRGISEKVLRTLFEPFSDDSLDKAKGFHLGMYICREFTQMMNGELEVESREGKGTTVVLRFDRA
ncbi:MAG: sensor histidine kinase [Calditrichia bacterium]